MDRISYFVPLKPVIHYIFNLNFFWFILHCICYLCLPSFNIYTLISLASCLSIKVFLSKKSFHFYLYYFSCHFPFVNSAIFDQNLLILIKFYQFDFRYQLIQIYHFIKNLSLTSYLIVIHLFSILRVSYSDYFNCP